MISFLEIEPTDLHIYSRCAHVTENFSLVICLPEITVIVNVNIKTLTALLHIFSPSRLHRIL